MNPLNTPLMFTYVSKNKTWITDQNLKIYEPGEKCPDELEIVSKSVSSVAGEYKKVDEQKYNRPVFKEVRGSRFLFYNNGKWRVDSSLDNSWTPGTNTSTSPIESSQTQQRCPAELDYFILDGRKRVFDKDTKVIEIYLGEDEESDPENYVPTTMSPTTTKAARQVETKVETKVET